jgi:putative membrane protein insertion efficiency factor
MAASASSPPQPPPSAFVRAVRAVVLAPIVVYQKAISPALPRRCKYEPTCSRYAVDAIRSYGILRGVVLASRRVLRCNPWSDGGYDPVQAQRVFKVRARTGV